MKLLLFNVLGYILLYGIKHHDLGKCPSLEAPFNLSNSNGSKPLFIEICKILICSSKTNNKGRSLENFCIVVVPIYSCNFDFFIIWSMIWYKYKYSSFRKYPVNLYFQHIKGTFYKNVHNPYIVMNQEKTMILYI